MQRFDGGPIARVGLADATGGRILLPTTDLDIVAQNAEAITAPVIAILRTCDLQKGVGQGGGSGRMGYLRLVAPAGPGRGGAMPGHRR